jgi:hypothetical protein
LFQLAGIKGPDPGRTAGQKVIKNFSFRLRNEAVEGGHEGVYLDSTESARIPVFTEVLLRG